MNSTAKITFKNVTYLVSDTLPHDKDEAYYESFFNREAILASEDTECKGGRGSTLLYKHDSRDLVLRHYCRGGMIGKVISDVFFRFEVHCHRAFNEFRLLENMLLLGLPVPKPVIAREESFLGFVTQDIVIERLNGYRDLSYVIDHRHLTEVEMTAIGRTLNRFFDAGIYHTDLNIRNIMIDKDCNVCVIDFDKCFDEITLSDELKDEMLSRLLRSFRKELTRKATTHFYESDFDALIKEAPYLKQ